MDSLINKLKIKPVAKHEKFFVNLGDQSNVDTEVPTQETLIIDRTDQPFDDKEFLESIVSKRKSKIIKSKLIKPPVDESEEEIEVVLKPVPKKSKKKLDIPSLIIEEENPDPSVPISVIDNVTKSVNEIDMNQTEDAPKEIEIEIPDEKLKRKYVRKEKGVVEFGSVPLVQIGDVPIDERTLPISDPIDIKVSSYFPNDREIFVNFIEDLFKPYKDSLITDKKDISCDDLGKGDDEFSLLTHQKIVRDYLNTNTPYRGLLLYHGLGSGKTCSSIAIAEGFLSSRQVIIMTPAYLRKNYIQEIKKCGNLLFRKNQYWEWIDLNSQPNSLNTLSAVLSLPREYIRKNKGAWLVNFSRPANFESLTNDQKIEIDEQLDEMIQSKYKFINYNGLSKKKFKSMTDNYKKNIFDNSVIIIDEAHNLVSRIVNKINKLSSKEKESNKFPDVLALKIYEFLLRANNARVVMLSGTPLVNYPNEIGILFNILRGYIKTWQFTLSSDSSLVINSDKLKEMFYRERTHDYIDYFPGTKVMTITRNPFGFENKVTANSGYKGLFKNEAQGITDEEFVSKVVKLLLKNKITAVERVSDFKVYTALPDKLDDFSNQFINEENGTIKNIEKFKRRIIGLPSYFRSAQEELLPNFDKIKDLHVIKIPMSDYQFRVYESARQEERMTEKPSNKKKKVDANGLYLDTASTYRIFSRLYCNFVMPKPPGRPTPKMMKLNQMLSVLISNLQGSIKKDIVEKLERQRREKLQLGGSRSVFLGEVDLETTGEPELSIIDLDDSTKFINEDQDKSTTLGIYTGGNEASEMAEKAILELGLLFPNLSMETIIEYLSKNIKKKTLDEIALDLQNFQNKKDGKTTEEDNLLNKYEEETEDILDKAGKNDATYVKALKTAIDFLKQNSSEYLSPEGLETYGRKFLAILENIVDPDHKGLNLVYSQFRTMEGIGIFSMVLEENGFSLFKIKRVGNTWDLDFPVEKLGTPMFTLYTGTEEEEEREITRNIYNGDWKDLPKLIKDKLEKVAKNNDLGEIIKIIMITAAGSEGINLRNTRYVHIMEPYWHPVRTEQVIGRARRICSHKNLPSELQNVEVFVYLMTFTPEQLKSEIANELRTKDLSKRAPYTPLTSDEKLFEISNIKEELTTELLKGIKEASIDCSLHVKSSIKEKLTCLSFGKPSSSAFSYKPSYYQDYNDNVTNLNKEKLEWRGQELTFNGKKMILRKATNEVFDYESYMNALEKPGLQPKLIGKLQKTKEGKYRLLDNP